MIDKLDAAFGFHEKALSLRAQRQQLIATNIANANVPGFQARDIDFAAALKAATGEKGRGGGNSGAPAIAMTRPGHTAGAVVVAGSSEPQYRVPGQASIDGNTVEMDQERAHFADNAIRYEVNLNVISTQIKSLMAALQG